MNSERREAAEADAAATTIGTGAEDDFIDWRAAYLDSQARLYAIQVLLEDAILVLREDAICPYGSNDR